jgi:steroid delta-isomerase-like uncharacterized protein
MNTSIFHVSVPIAAMLLLGACSGAPDGQTDPKRAEHTAMMQADSAAKAHVSAQEATTKAIIELFNTASTEGVENLLTDNFLDHQQDPSVKATGLQGVKEMMAMYHTAFPDFKQEILGMSTTGDRTYVHLRLTGTNSGPWGAMPATGKTMDVMGADVIRFENGKAAEHWGYMEEMKMMTQLGLMPPPGEEPKKK